MLVQGRNYTFLNIRYKLYIKENWKVFTFAIDEVKYGTKLSLQM